MNSKIYIFVTLFYTLTLFQAFEANVEETSSTTKKIRLGGADAIPVDDPLLIAVLQLSLKNLNFHAQLEVSSTSGQEGAEYRIGKIVSATRQVVAGSIYSARFELIEVECPTPETEVESCNQKGKRLCNISVWKKIHDEELEVKELKCDS